MWKRSEMIKRGRDLTIKEKRNVIRVYHTNNKAMRLKTKLKENNPKRDMQRNISQKTRNIDEKVLHIL